tara:strand:- start:441 stop:572 length:132 start_codon:yes stop_codon:yes gene_type:complete
MKRRTGKDLGMLSNLNIKKKQKIIMSVETVILLKIEIISCKDA